MENDCYVKSKPLGDEGWRKTLRNERRRAKKYLIDELIPEKEREKAETWGTLNNLVMTYSENLEEAMETLPNERLVCLLKKRYWEHMTYEKAGRAVVRVDTSHGHNACEGIGGQAARQMIQKAIRMLRHPLRQKILKGEMTARQYFEGGIYEDLSPRAWNCLANMGYKNPSKEEVKEAIESGQFLWKKKTGQLGEDWEKMRNFGKGTYLEICKWAKATPPTPAPKERKCPHCGRSYVA